MPVGWPDLADAVTVGRSEIVIGDGTPRFAVLAADARTGEVRARCERPGVIAPRKGIFVTYVQAPLPTLGERDLADLAVACELEADFVALSFVRSGQDVRRLRGALDALGGDARVIAKIEKVEAVRGARRDRRRLGRGDGGPRRPGRGGRGRARAPHAEGRHPHAPAPRGSW